jgi:uncharacterized protein
MNKTALITGASSGIGREFANILAEKGVNLVLVARNIKMLSEIKLALENQFKIDVLIIEQDLSVLHSAQEIFQIIKSKNIRIEYLINNAGFGDFGFFIDSNWEKSSQMIQLNITTLTELCRLFVPLMIQNKSGNVLNVASIAAFQSGPLMSVYFASKAYVLNFSEALNNEVKDQGVRITTLCPGPTKSNFQEVASMNDSKLFNHSSLPSSRDVADYGIKAMLKGQTIAIHGLKNNILVFLIRLFPRFLAVNITGLLMEKM